jgi:ribonuclease P protein component
MIGRLIQAADFKRLLAVPPAFRSAHFVIHHLVEAPVRPAYVRKNSGLPELSTAHQDICPQAVEDFGEIPHQESPDKGFPRWLGCVVPKRHARRAVTRNLIKRQVYAAAGRVELAGTGPVVGKGRESSGFKGRSPRHEQGRATRPHQA